MQYDDANKLIYLNANKQAATTFFQGGIELRIIKIIPNFKGKQIKAVVAYGVKGMDLEATSNDVNSKCPPFNKSNVIACLGTAEILSLSDVKVMEDKQTWQCIGMLDGNGLVADEEVVLVIKVIGAKDCELSDSDNILSN